MDKKILSKERFCISRWVIKLHRDLDGEIDHLKERIEELENPDNPEEDFMFVAKRQWEQW